MPPLEKIELLDEPAAHAHFANTPPAQETGMQRQLPPDARLKAGHGGGASGEYRVKEKRGGDREGGRPSFFATLDQPSALRRPTGAAVRP